MGGVIFLIGITATGLIFAPSHPHVIPVLILMLGFGVIGLIDDLLKTVKRKSDGLIAWQKFLLQILVSTIFLWYLLSVEKTDLTMLVPFSKGYALNLGFWAIPIFYFAVIGTVNGVNFTDGLDGLASTVTAVVAGFFIYASERLSGGIEPVAAAVLGGLLAFLLFNVYPAKVFMGDTGSLALGGFVAASAYMLHMPLFILIIGFIYLLEVVSVILQVGYFKATHGKRIFRMAPIHHHFELGGWSETRVVAVFSVATFLLCLLGAVAMGGF